MDHLHCTYTHTYRHKLLESQTTNFAYEMIELEMSIEN